MTAETSPEPPIEAVVAGVSVAFTLPWLLFALISGALVDRLDRRVVMYAVGSVRKPDPMNA